MLFITSHLKQHLCAIGIFTTALMLSLWRADESGEQWLEDGPRYLNNAAMVHDWILSGEYLHPVEFASQNYAQYPAHNVPYHPPGYAFFLAVWFLTFGMSYISARFFIGVCLAVSAIIFFEILNLQKIPRSISLLSTLLFLSLPEVTLWGRTAMSEVPALMFMMLGSFAFLKALKVSKNSYFWIAYLFAILGFFCRHSSAGILPAWGVLFLMHKSKRPKVWLHYTIPSAIYILIGAGWVNFSSAYSQHEMRKSPSESVLTCFTYENLTVWWFSLPDSVGWICVSASLLSLFIMPRLRIEHRRFACFWLSWLIGCYGLVVLLNMPHEHRYFFFGIPSIVAISQIAATQCAAQLKKTWVGAMITAAIITSNYQSITAIDDGLVGFDKVAEFLAEQSEEGNVLLASHIGDSDTIFRYRALPNKLKRIFFRSDRTLSIRFSDYYRADFPTDPLVLADSIESAIDIIKNGKIRFLVTWEYLANELNQRPDEHICYIHDDVVFASKLASTSHFTLAYTTTVSRKKVSHKVRIWKYVGDFPDKEIRLSVPIPTANLNLEFKDPINRNHQTQSSKLSPSNAVSEPEAR